MIPCSTVILISNKYALVMARFRVQYVQYFLSFSFYYGYMQFAQIAFLLNV